MQMSIGFGGQRRRAVRTAAEAGRAERRWSRFRESVNTCGDDARLSRGGQPDQEPGHHRSNSQTDKPAHGLLLSRLFR